MWSHGNSYITVIWDGALVERLENINMFVVSIH